MKKLFVLFLLTTPIFATLGTKSIWEMRTTNGLDTNGGCFDSGVASPGTDFTQQNTLQKAYTDLVAPSTTTITSVSRPFSSVDPGNCIHIASGTGWTVGWFEIISVSGSTATVDRAIATISSTGGTGSYGGALKTFTQLNTNMTTNHGAFVKAEAIITTNATFTLSFTCLSTTNQGCPIIGYTTTRTDNGSVTVQASANATSTLVNVTNGGGILLKNFIFDCNSKTSTNGVNVQGNAVNKLENVLTKGGCALGITFNNLQHICVRCGSVGALTTGITLSQGNGPNYCIYCFAVGGTGTGIVIEVGGCNYCIAANNTGASSDGIQVVANTANALTLSHIISYKNGRDGIRFATDLRNQPVVENSIIYGNTGWGINSVGVPNSTYQYTINYNALGSNTLGARVNIATGTGDIALSADPFTNGTGSADFSLNATVGGGAAVKGLGYPGAFTVGGVTVGTGGIDIGTLQTAVAAGAGSSGSPIIQ